MREFFLCPRNSVLFLSVRPSVCTTSHSCVSNSSLTARWIFFSLSHVISMLVLMNVRKGIFPVDASNGIMGPYLIFKL